MEKQELANTLFIDLSASTGPVRHEACGFLYGLGKADIPSVNTLAPLKPQVAAQKPEGGLQHPNGDALNVSETYKAAGGREIEIYIQDVYPNCPVGYKNLSRPIWGKIFQFNLDDSGCTLPVDRENPSQAAESIIQGVRTHPHRLQS